MSVTEEWVLAKATFCKPAFVEIFNLFHVGNLCTKSHLKLLYFKSVCLQVYVLIYWCNTISYSALIIKSSMQYIQWQCIYWWIQGSEPGQVKNSCVKIEITTKRCNISTKSCDSTNKDAKWSQKDTQGMQRDQWVHIQLQCVCFIGIYLQEWNISFIIMFSLVCNHLKVEIIAVLLV